MTVREIITAYLREHGYDGLCNDDCGCGIDDLAPCGGDYGRCVPAHKDGDNYVEAKEAD